jgi:hypothetical protein
MKKLNVLSGLVIFAFTFSLNAQNNESTNVDSKSYYEQRALEDAKYEQELVVGSIEEEQEFWEDQKQYEKDLKKRDKKAYRAYIKGKRDAYQEHYEYCSSHCHHGQHYYTHATYYYYGYNRRHYYRSSNSGVRTRVSLPRVSIGLF